MFNNGTAIALTAQIHYHIVLFVTKQLAVLTYNILYAYTKLVIHANI